MNTLKKTLFIIATVSVTAYTIRHIYLKWFNPQESVLDKYAATSTTAIKAAHSLEELEKLYVDAHAMVEAYESNPENPKITGMDREDTEPYKTEREVTGAINDWEAKTRDIFELRFYWIVGAFLVVLGFVLYRWVNPWLGLTAIIAGFSEKVYWTSPSFMGGTVEYSRLLTNKIVFSLLTLIFLITLAFLTETFKTAKTEVTKIPAKKRALKR